MAREGRCGVAAACGPTRDRPLGASIGMWMSPQWNGIPSAFRYLVMTLGALIFLSLPDHDTSEP